MVWLRADFEHVAPVVSGRAKALDNRMQGDHSGGHAVAGGIGIEAAVDRVTLVQQRLQPAWVGPGPGGGEATVVGMKVRPPVSTSSTGLVAIAHT